MDFKKIEREISRFKAIVAGWENLRPEQIASVERELALDKLKTLYEMVRFDGVGEEEPDSGEEPSAALSAAAASAACGAEAVLMEQPEVAEEAGLSEQSDTEEVSEETERTTFDGAPAAVVAAEDDGINLDDLMALDPEEEQDGAPADAENAADVAAEPLAEQEEEVSFEIAPVDAEGEPDMPSENGEQSDMEMQPETEPGMQPEPEPESESESEFEPEEPSEPQAEDLPLSVGEEHSGLDDDEEISFQEVSLDPIPVQSDESETAAEPIALSEDGESVGTVTETESETELESETEPVDWEESAGSEDGGGVLPESDGRSGMTVEEEWDIESFDGDVVVENTADPVSESGDPQSVASDPDAVSVSEIMIEDNGPHNDSEENHTADDGLNTEEPFTAEDGQDDPIAEPALESEPVLESALPEEGVAEEPAAGEGITEEEMPAENEEKTNEEAEEDTVETEEPAAEAHTDRENIAEEPAADAPFELSDAAAQTPDMELPQEERPADEDPMRDSLFTRGEDSDDRVRLHRHKQRVIMSLYGDGGERDDRGRIKREEPDFEVETIPAKDGGESLSEQRDPAGSRSDAERFRPKKEAFDFVEIDLNDPEGEDGEDDLRMVEPLREAAGTKTVLGEVIRPKTETLGDSFVPQQGLGDTLVHAHAAANLEQGIGINDKFLLIRDLFNDDVGAYNQVIHILNQFEELDDCLIYIAENYTWNPNSEGAKLLMKLLKRKFEK